MLSVVRHVCPGRKKWRDTAVKVVLKPSYPSDFWKRVLEVHAAKVFLDYFVLTCGAFRSSGHFQLEQKGKIYRNNQFFPADFPINPYIDEFWVNITIPSAIKSRILPATRPPCVVDFHGFSYYSSIFSYDLPIKTFIFPSFFHGTFGISQLFGLAAKAMDNAERGSASSGSEDSESSASSTIFPTRPLDDGWWGTQWGMGELKSPWTDCTSMYIYGNYCLRWEVSWKFSVCSFLMSPRWNDYCGDDDIWRLRWRWWWWCSIPWPAQVTWAQSRREMPPKSGATQILLISAGSLDGTL